MERGGGGGRVDPAQRCSVGTLTLPTVISEMHWTGKAVLNNAQKAGQKPGQMDREMYRKSLVKYIIS